MIYYIYVMSGVAMEITTLRANQSYEFGRESQRVEFLLMEKEGFC